MFTGLIEATARVRRVEGRGSGLRLVLGAPTPAFEVVLGQSVAVSGACLSVAEFLEPGVDRPRGGAGAGADLAFDLSAETLARTWLGELAAGQVVNLERAMRLSDRLDGHLVSGHVDGTGRLIARRDTGDGGARMTFEVPAALERYLIEKGSITLDGISLTVVEPQAGRFDVALIPLTLAHTSLGSARVGSRVNVEVDLVGKWIERLLPPRA